jgi:lysophospholipase L1-like esterase
MKVAFLGDSLTEGTPGSSFFALLRDELLPDHELLNLGRAGDTIGDLAQRVRATGLVPVEAAFIWVGVNDAFVAGWDTLVTTPEDEWWETTLGHLSAVYQGLIDWTLRRAAIVVCVPPFLGDFAGDEAFALRTTDVAGLVRSLTWARTHTYGRRLRLFDLGAALAARRSAGPPPAVSRDDAGLVHGPPDLDTTVTIDGVHLNDRGARLVAEEFAVEIHSLRAQGAAGDRGAG